MHPRKVDVVLAAMIPTAILSLGGCAARTATPRANAGRPSVVERVDLADRLMRAGCLDCLLEALESYRQLLTHRDARELASRRVAELGTLIALRERELGLPDSGRLPAAPTAQAGAERSPTFDEQLRTTAALLPVRPDGAALDEATLLTRQRARTERDAHTTYLEPRADESVVSAYVWLSFNCTYGAPDADKLRSWLAAIPSWRDTALMTYRAATCGVLDLVTLDRLLAADSRFGELGYFLGIVAPPAGEVDPTIARLQGALAWRSEWPAAAFALANAHLDREEFEDALEWFTRMRDLRPHSPDALFGRARALTHVARYQDALVEVDRLIALGQWYVGDARFWRALNHLQLGRVDEAWTDIELAASLLVNSEVPKLAGIIAMRRQDLDVARQRFELSRRRNPKDCETGFHLGNVLSQQRSWSQSTQAYVETTACLERDEERLVEEIATLERSSADADYRARQIARREEQVEAGRQMRAGAWFNSAVGYFNLSRFDDARQAAERVRDDPFYSGQARALLTRLARR